MDKPTSADTTPVTTAAESAADDAGPPARPTAGDITLLQSLQQFELAARDLYRAWGSEFDDAASAAGQGYDALPGLVAQVAANHDQWSASISGLLGVRSPQTVDQAVVDQWQAQLTGPDATIGGLAFESAALESLFALIGQLESTRATNLLVAMARVTGEHCVAFAAASGQADDLDVMLGTTGATA